LIVLTSISRVSVVIYQNDLLSYMSKLLVDNKRKPWRKFYCSDIALSKLRRHNGELIYI